MQLELKYRRHLEDLIREKQETLNLRNRFQKDAENEAEKLKRAEEERLKFAASLREDILKRAAYKNEQKKQELKKGALLNLGNNESELKNERDRKSNKQKLNQETCLLIQNLVKQKNERERALILESQELEQRNALINDVKFLNGERRKNFVKEIANARLLKSEIVAGKLIRESEEKAKNHESYLSKIVHAKDAEYSIRRDKEKKNKEALLAAEKEFQDAHKLKVMAAKKAAIEEQENDRKKVIDAGIKWEAEKQSLLKKKLDSLQLLKEEQTTQIKQNKILKLKRETLKLANECKENIGTQHEQEEFEKYANTLISEWQANGKPVHNIKRTVDKFRSNTDPVRIAENVKNGDTFSRLGFTKLPRTPFPTFNSTE